MALAGARTSQHDVPSLQGGVREWCERGVGSPPHWRYPLFPADGETLDVEALVRLAHDMLDSASSDDARIGPVLHWAHVLKSEQGPDGAWPALVNARTGEPGSDERTLAPAAMLERLGELLDSTEFDAAVAFAHGAHP